MPNSCPSTHPTRLWWLLIFSLPIWTVSFKRVRTMSICFVLFALSQPLYLAQNLAHNRPVFGKWMAEGMRAWMWPRNGFILVASGQLAAWCCSGPSNTALRALGIIRTQLLTWTPTKPWWKPRRFFPTLSFLDKHLWHSYAVTMTMESSQFHGSRRKENSSRIKPLANIFIKASKI